MNTLNILRWPGKGNITGNVSLAVCLAMVCLIEKFDSNNFAQ